MAGSLPVDAEYVASREARVRIRIDADAPSSCAFARPVLRSRKELHGSGSNVASGHADAVQAPRRSCMLSRMATPPISRAPRKKTGPQVQFRMRIRNGDTVALGPGKIALLEAVREHGSISAAARSLEMSYRRAWLLIDELNRSLKSPATISEQGGQKGGGCVLTPVGQDIVRLYRDVEMQAHQACAKQLAALLKLIEP